MLSACLYAQAPQPQHPEMTGNNSCDFKTEPGKPINFSMTIKGVDPLKYNQLYARVSLILSPHDPDIAQTLQQIIASSPATRDAQDPNLFHFVYTLPKILAGGVYSGTKLGAYYSESESSSQPDTKAQDEANAYCLMIINGNAPGKLRITGFAPDPMK